MSEKPATYETTTMEITESTNVPLRDGKGRFLPGQTGNAGGRPKKLQEFTELAQKHTPEAFEAVVDILNDPDTKPADRLRAAEMILDRALGKPLQASQIELDTDVNGRFIEVVFNHDLEKWSK